MKKFIPILILFLTITYSQNRFAKSGKSGGVQKDVVEKMRSTSNQNVPRRISYQGLITKADGSPTDDGSYEILFKVFETADGGEAIWSENQEVTVNNGIISTILGNTNPFTVVPPEAFLELTVSGSTLSPRQVLTSVFYSVLSDTSGYAKAADYGSLSNLPDLDVYVLKDSLASYPTSADLYDTLSVYQTLDSNLTDLVEDGILSASKIEYGISSVGDSGQTWISDGDGAGRWGNPSSVAADDIIIGDGNISIQTINGGVSIVPSDGYGIVLDSTLTIDGNLMGITNDTDLLTFSRDTLTVRGTVMASTIGGFAVLDEDDMASDSDVQLATQQSIKTYVDTKQDYDEDLETIGSQEHVDGNFLVSNGSEWTVESDSIARASLGLGSIAMLDSDNMDINGGTIDGTIIGAENPQVGNFTTVQAQSRAYVGDMIIDSGSISTEGGTVSFDDDIITTTGTLSSGSGSTIGNLTLADGSISSSSNQLDFGDDDLSTTGTLSTGIATLGSGSTIGNLIFTDGAIASESDNISFGSDNLSTNGTLTAGVSTFSSGSEIGDLTISNGSITSSSDAIDFGNDALSTTGTLSTGTATLATGSTVGNLTLADGSINSSSDAIDFGNNTLTTSSNITANSFTGDGSNITGVEASSMGVLAGVSPIVFEGESINDYETILSVEDPTLSDKTITFPNATGTIITTGNDSAIDEVGTITAGQWQGTAIADAYVPNDITLSGGTIDNSVIGGTTPAAVTATTLTANTGFIPDESDGAYLGTSSAEFSDVFLADGAVINLGDEQDVTLTHIEDTGIKLNGSNQLQFGDSGTQISQSADGVLDLVSDNEVEINGTTIDLNGSVDVSGVITAGSTITTTGSLLPSSVDGAGLGSASAEFSDVFLADGGVINLGNNQDVTLTHIKDTGIKINDANQLQFGDSGTQISQSADGVLDLVSDSEVEINGTIIDMNGVVDISGAVTTGSTITTTGSLLPSSSDGAGIGSSTAEFSDVFLADGAVINLGDNQEVSLTHIEDEGLRLNSLSQLQFGDSGTKISQSADGVLDLVSDNEVEINGTTIDLNGDVTLDNATVDFVKIDGTYVGHVDDTDLMNLANGALTVAGTLAATTFSGDGSNLTGISASSIKADDVSQGDAAVNISTSSGAININPASGSPVLIDNTINIDGSLIGHADDTDLMTLANGSVTFTGSTVIPTADVNGGAIDAVTLGTNSAVTQAVIDNVNINGVEIGHTDDTDLMTLADGSVTFTGSTVIPTADVNGGAIDAVTLGTNSPVTQAVIDNINMNGAQIGHSTDTDLMTLSNGTLTVAGTVAATAITGDGSALTGITASGMKSDDISQGDAAVTISTSSGAVNINPASGSPILLDNTINIDGSLIGHTDDTDLMTLADGSVTFTGSTVIPTADVNGGAIDAVTLGTNSAVTQAVIDNVNINGVEIGHTDDTDLMTLADGSVTFTGSTVIPTADVNGGAIDAVTLGTNSAVTQAVIDNVSINGSNIGHTDDTDLLTLANGVATVAGEISVTTLDIGGTDVTSTAAELNKLDDVTATTTELNYVDVTTLGTSQASKAVTVDANGDLLVPDSDKYKFGAGSDMQLYHDGSNSYITNATGAMKVATETSGIAVTIGHSTSETTVGDNLAVGGDALVTGDVTITGNDIAFGNGETISNATDGDFLFTTGTQTGALTVKNSNTTDGIASLELVSDNSGDVGDGYELKSVNGTFTVTSDHSTKGTYEDTYLTIVGNSTPASSSTTIAGDLTIAGDDLTMGTNTSGAALIGDGTNYNPVLISGDLSIGSNGTAAISSNVIVNADINASAAIADSKLATITTADKVSGAAIQVDGATSGTGITLADDDKFLVDDGGTTKYVNASQVLSYASATSSTDINGGTIDGVTLGTNSAVTQAVIDNVNINGAEIGHTSDTDLMTLADGSVTFTGSTVITSVDVNGGAVDGVTLGTNSAVSQAVIDNINLNGTTIGHTDDTDLMTLADGSVTFTGSTVIPVADVNGGAVDGITLGTNSAVTQAVIDNVNINGVEIGHTSDTDLMTLANGSVTFTGSTVITSADVNAGTIDGVTLGTNSAVTHAVIDNVNINGAEIGHTSDTDLMTLADGSVTFTGSTVITSADVNGGAIDAVTLGTNSAVTQAVVDNINLNGTTIGHTDDTDLMTLASGSVTFTGSTVVPNADINGGAVDGVTLGTNSAVTQAVIDNVNINGATIGHTSDTDLLTLSSGVVTLAGNLTFENGESVSNATDGDFLFTTDVTDGALVLKNSNATDGISKIELVSDNADNAGDGYEIKSVNGTFTVTSDHSSSGTYNDTYLTIDGNATPASSTTKIAGDLLVDGGQIALTGDTDLITLSSGVVTVAGELSATTLDINGTDITSTAAELNFNDGTSAGTVVASKTVVVDANKDIASFRNVTLTGELDAASLDVSGNADIDGTLEADVITVNGSSLASVIQGTTVNSATTGTNVVITDNESTSENNAIAFVANADLDGNSSIGLESDGDLHYNPSTGTVTATAFVGDGSNLTGITASTIGTLSGANAISFRDTDLAINSSTDGQMDINADVTLDIQAPTTALSGDITVSGNDISFGNSETISNASDNVIAITSASTTLSGDLTVTGNDITFGNGETISNDTDGDFIFTTGTANGAFTLKNSNSSDGKAAIELVSDNANEVGDGYEIKSLNGVFTVTGDHSTGGTYDDTFITVNGNSTPTSSYTTIAGDLRVDGGDIGVSGDTDLITLASGRATIDGELVVTSLDIGGTDITSTPAEINIIDGNTSATVTTVADADRVIYNDNGTMVQVAVTDLAAYFDDKITAMPNLATTAATTVGALGSGSIASGFGGINNGSSAITTSGTVTYGTLNDGSNNLTTTVAELNIVDGNTSATGTTVVGADRVVLNDNGSMVQVAVTDIDTYISATSKTLTNKTLSSPTINTPTITGNTTFSDGSYNFDIASHDGTNGLLLDGTVVTATAAELNYTDVTTLGTSEASKALTASASGHTIIPDDKLLKFGTNEDWTIEYDENGNDDLVMTGSDLSIESSVSAKPILNILNTNADANGSTIKLNKNGSSPATNDLVGNIDFISEDSGNNVTTYGRIQSTIVDVTSGGEEGGIDFYVAEYDGALTKGLEIKGLATDGNITVDISTHDGSAGGLKLGGTLVTAEAADLNTYTLNVALADVSTASSCFVVAPKAGTISAIHSIIDGTLATDNAVVTANVNGGSNISNQITIANSSGAGTIDTCSPGDNNTVSAGNYIQLTTDGASTNTVSAVFTITITL